ncbi:hypothetical protein P9112_001704 [Eukaryota sp. TZLM1-RC]
MSLQAALQPSSEKGIAKEDEHGLKERYESIYDRVDALVTDLSISEVAAVPASYKIEVDLILRITFALFRIGFPVYSSEVLLTKLADRFGLELYISSKPTNVDINIKGEKRRQTLTTHYVVQLPHVLPGPFNLSAHCRYSYLVLDIIYGNVTIEDCYHRLFTLLASPSLVYPSWVYIVFGSVASSAMVTLFPQTTWVDASIAAFLGAFVQLCLLLSERSSLWLRPLKVYEFVVPFISAILTATFAFFLQISIEEALVSGVVWLLPGISITAGVLEVYNYHYEMGLSRLLFSILVVVLIASGIKAGLKAVGVNQIEPPNFFDGPAFSFEFTLVSVPVMALAFAILYNLEVIHLPAFLITSMAAFYIERVARLATAEFSVLISAFVVGCLAMLYNYLFHIPVIVLIIAGISFLVPGNLAVMGFVEGFEDEFISVGESMLSVLQIAVSISLGVSTPYVFFKNSRSF